MNRLMYRLRPVLAGGVMLGVLQAAMGIDWNSLLFQFILTWISVLINVLMGGDTSSLLGSTGGFSSLLGGFGF